MGGTYLTPLIPSRIQKIVNISVDCSDSVWLRHGNWTHTNLGVLDSPDTPMASAGQIGVRIRLRETVLSTFADWTDLERASFRVRAFACPNEESNIGRGLPADIETQPLK